METFGQAARRFRGGMSLREAARRAHLDSGHLSRVEADKRPPTPLIAQALDEIYQAGGELAALADARGEPWKLDNGIWRPKDSERLAAAVLATTPTAENARTLAHMWLIAEPPQVTATRAGRRIGVSQVMDVEKRVHQLRKLDDYVGGQDTHAMVTGELMATAALLRDAAYTEGVGRRLLVAIGELAQVAGWVTSDAGRHAEAERYYLAGMRAAHAGGDVAGAANNLSSLAYQIANVGDAREAVTLAKSAFAGARHAASATTKALLAERIAWAEARVGEVGAAERALGTVEEQYGHRQPADDPIWVYWLDEGEIDIMAGRVWTQLRRPLRAVPILERATAGYGEETGRETSLYLTWLAESLLQANEVERAAEAATRALHLSRKAGSSRVTERLRILRAKLARCPGVAEAFREEAHAAGELRMGE
ncbi:helix-turn-helix domain-containing protein [Krasilnikovia sp. MM14-A1004]|uniref:helix-turn-helix domain-containing protein n=1 Tax=Krasilnikovia sp. MM14-A1004 TaxID=3373541 RepID=UPI00399C9B8A